MLTLSGMGGGPFRPPLSENRDFSGTEPPLDLRPVCKFKFVRCGPVEKITSRTTGARGCKFEQFWTILSILNHFLYISRSIFVSLDLSWLISFYLGLYLCLSSFISGYIWLSKTISDFLGSISIYLGLSQSILLYFSLSRAISNYLKL